MSDFHERKTVGATRKAHRCGECENKIAKGARAVVSSGNYNGDFYCQHIHVDCEAVARAYAEQFDLWGEDTVHLHELVEPDELLWLIGEHSAVAERLKAEQRLADRELFYENFFATKVA